MKISVDNQVIRLFSTEGEKLLNGSLGEESVLHFAWPSFLEYLELGNLFSRLSPFDSTNLLFKASVSALCEVDNPEDLFYIYDSLFTEMLKQVKSLPEMDPLFLLQKIEEKKEKLSFWEMEKFVSPPLSAREKELREDAPNAMHDLVLYLGWDRMCVSMGRLFDYQSNDPKYLQNLKNLKWCLIESYQHIAGQGRTSPSFYRMQEALFYYEMREEHLQLHPEADWELLTQSFPVLKDPNELIDCFYIDHAVVTSVESNLPLPSHLTLDPPEIVERRLALARYMIDRLKEEIPQWKYTLLDSHIIHLT